MTRAAPALPQLLYFADPMCSWCWGFSPVIYQLRDKFAERLVIAMVMGGLRPGTTAILQEPLKSEIQHHWKQVAAVTGADFDFSFFERQDFIYDTEPACRAVIAFSRFRPEETLDYYTRLQCAFYNENKDITDIEVLREEAVRFGADPNAFVAACESKEMREGVLDSFRRSREAGVRSFPTLVGVSGQDAELLCVGYKQPRPLVTQIENWLANLNGK